jgi:hypothetical protein
MGTSAQANGIDVRPLIAESSTSESTTVEVTMNDLRDKIVRIPDYQRDSDQWDEPTKSLLVESVINNLSIPAFFFEVIVDGGVERNDVVDGQQRLTTLFDFFECRFRLVGAEDAPYISPNSVSYAGKIFKELPVVYQQAFKKYRLAVIKLRDLAGMRLEIFRRINQGGTPLSGQDIRLAYYGDKCASLALVRLSGVYDPERQAARRFLDSARTQYDLRFPWTSSTALQVWREWWEEKDIARGQTPSEAFLWSLVTAQVEELDSILGNPDALRALNVRFSKGIAEALDAYCAQLKWQDTNSSIPPLIMTFVEIRDSFFPYFQNWVDLLIGQKGPSLPVIKHRIVASLIGASYKKRIDPTSFSEQQWTNIVEFVRRPQDLARKLNCEWPLSKGRWDGQRGYKSQMKAAQGIILRIANAGSAAQ